MKLSIITINYNNAEGLKKTIESTTNQSHKYFEYIVVDGNSSDDSVEIIKAKEKYIDKWISEPDKGIFNAMNKGITMANGEYLLFLNSGDIINQECNFEKVLSDVYNEDIIYFNINIVGEHKPFIKNCPEYLDFKFFIEDTLPHQSTFIKKRVLEEYGGYKEYMKIAADWAFFMDAICINKYSYRYVKQSFSTYYLDGISGKQENFSILWAEKNSHIENKYLIYNSFYKDYISKRQELYRLKTSFSVNVLKKIGFLKWLKK